MPSWVANYIIKPAGVVLPVVIAAGLQLMGIKNMYCGIGLLSFAGLWLIGIVLISIPRIKNRILPAKPALKIKIQISESTSSNVENELGHRFVFKIVFALETPTPPVQIAKLQLVTQYMDLEPVDIEIPFILEQTVQSYIATFGIQADPYSAGQIKEQDKYYLRMFALGQEWVSNEFALEHRNVLIKL